MLSLHMDTLTSFCYEANATVISERKNFIKKKGFSAVAQT